MSTPNIRASALALAAALALFAGAGCAETEVIEPAFPIEGHRMVIIPMKGRLQHHYDYDKGTLLAKAIADRLEARRKELGEDFVIDIVPYQDMENAVGSIHKDPKDIPHADLGRAVSADLVLIGDLKQFGPAPGNVGFSRGRAVCAIRIIDVAKPDRAFFTRTITCVFPDDDMGSTGVLDLDQENEDALETGLLAKLVDEISKLFYAWEKKAGAP